MKISKIQNELYGVTEVSDIFISEYMPGLPPHAVKLYLYMLYSSKKSIEFDESALSMILSCDLSVVRENIIILESMGLITCQDGLVLLNDIVQNEIDRNYRPRTSCKPCEVNVNRQDKAYERAKIQKAISDNFFAGQMTARWYNEIDTFFEKYGFEPEVVFLLFQHCAKQGEGKISPPYVRKVAEDWGNNQKIKTPEQLERYLNLYDEYSKYRNEIMKKLRYRRNMTVYEEEIIKKWFYTYKYKMDIIEIALKKSKNKMNASIATYDNIITSWYKNGLKTIEEISQFEAERIKLYKDMYAKNKAENKLPNNQEIRQKNNYTQREYDDDFLNSLFTDLTSKKEENL